MENTIVLDSNSLQQILRDGPGGALETSLLARGSNLATTRNS